VLHDELPSMVRNIISQARPGDVVLLDSGSRYPVFLYDYERLAPGATRPEFATISRAEDRLNAAQVDAWLDEHLKADSRIWLAEVEVGLSDPEYLVRAALAERLSLTASWAYDYNTLLLYAADGQPPQPENTTYAPEHEANVTLGGGELAGWDLPVMRYEPGTVAHLALQWRTAPDEAVWGHLQSAAGVTLLRRRLPEAQGAVRMTPSLLLPAALPPGRYALALDSASGQHLALGEIQLVDNGTAIETAVAAGEPLDVTFQGLTLVSGAVHAPKSVSGGDEILVDLAWRADAVLPKDYTIFVHVLGAAFNPATNGPLWGQQDAAPWAGQWPTSSWQPGDEALERYCLTLPDDIPAGDYQLEIGVYDPQTGERLTASNADGQALGDHLALPGFTVK